MADKNSSLGERSKKRGNRFLLLLGLALLILGGMAYCGMQGGRYGRRAGEQPVQIIEDDDPRLKNTKGEFENFRPGEGYLEATPLNVEMNGVVLGSQAEAIVTLTAKQAPILFVGMELAETQEGGFVLGGTCEPNKVIQKDATCSLKVMWNPTTLRQIQNTLSIRWREDNPAVFEEGYTTVSLKAQSTDSKDCVICETPCKDKEAEIKKFATTFDGKLVEIGKDGKATIDGEEYTIKDGLGYDKEGNIVLVADPEKIPLTFDNQVMGTISNTGDVLGKDGKSLGRLLGDDTIVDSSLNVLGAAVPVVSVMNSQGKVIGKVMSDGTVVDGAKNVIGRPMVDGSVVNLEGTPIGYLRPFGLVVNWTGDVIGGIIPDGSVVNGKKQIVGSVKPNGLVVDPNGELVGGVVQRGIAVGAACKALGFVLPNGQVQNSFSQIIGKTLLNGSVVDEKGMDIGTSVRMGLVINEQGDVVGVVNSEGKAVDAKGSLIGCVNPDGTVSAGSKIIGAIMPKGYAIGRECDLIGSVYPNGVVMNAAIEVMGQVRPDSHVVNVNNKMIGSKCYQSFFVLKDINMMSGAL